MRRFLFGAGAALTFALLSAFTLVSLTVQTARARWSTYATGQTAVRGVPFFGSSFGASSDPTGTVSYGPAKWRTAGVQCGVFGAGTTDGGTNALVVDIVHEDGGVDCQCSLGSSSCQGNGSFSCACTNGITQLAGATWQMQFDSTSSCAAMPGNGTGYSLFCSTDLFR